MAISANYATLQKQIADELGDRQDLLSPLGDSALSLSPIQNAIQSAIALWEREPFYFSQTFVMTGAAGPYAFKTVVGQEFYSAADYAPIGSFAKIRKVWILISQNRYTLNERTSQYLDDVSVDPGVTGEPIDYAYAGLMLRFNPIPNGVYPVGFEAIQRFTALVNDGDTNAWTQDGFDLIRCQAKLILAEEVLKNSELRDLMVSAIYGDPQRPQRRGYLAALKGESTRRTGRGKIQPTAF